MTGSRGPRPAEQRGYLAFMAAGLAFTLGAGLVLAVLVPVAAAGPGGSAREAELVQAHGWSQVQGFAGLVAAGMGLRLLPRLCGRRPLPAGLVAAAFALLVSGTALRVAAQALLPAPAQHVAGPVSGALGGAGMAVVAAAFAVTLARSRRLRAGWRLPAWAAAGWWCAWAIVAVAGGVLGGGNGGLVPDRLDVPATWVALLGAIGNLVWTIQARSVPVFYGRRPPGAGALAAPLALFNCGLAAVLASAAAGDGSLRRAGLAAAGAGMLALAPLCGSVRGRAHRLHEGSRPAAVFVVTANRWAMLAGGLLLAAPALALAGRGEAADGLEDAALHAVGLGLVTTLIPGMARLLTPVFAIERAEPGLGGPPDRGRRGLGGAGRATWLALTAATALRVLAGLAGGASLPEWRARLVVVSGSLAWAGLLVFAGGFARAWARQGALAARLRRAALDG